MSASDLQCGSVPPAAAPVHLPVHHKRVHRIRFISAVAQDLPAVLTVLFAGAAAIRSERAGIGVALAAVELVVGAVVLVRIALEARHLFSRAGAHHAPAMAGDAWIDSSSLAAAAVGYVEVWRHAHEVGHLKIVSPAMLTATASLFIALGGRRLIARRMRGRRQRHLTIDENGVSYRASRRRRWVAPWPDIVAIEHDDEQLVIRLRDGKQRVVRARDHLGGEALIAGARNAINAHAPDGTAKGAPSVP